MKKADVYIASSFGTPVKNILHDGGTLLVQPILSRDVFLDDVVFAVSQNGQILVSMRDFTEVLDLPISINPEQRTVSGWYIREHKIFQLDFDAGAVTTDHGVFGLPKELVFEGSDVLVPIGALGKWLNFDFELKVATQELHIESEEKLPIEEKILRRKDRLKGRKMPDISLPRGDDDYNIVTPPSIDVSTRSTYNRRGRGASGDDTHNVSVRTANDLAYGTVTSQSLWNNINQLQNVRVNYKRESPEPELLGPLKARRYELGDVTTTRIPLGGVVTQELGGRVTNTDALRTFTSPSTAISGTAFSGWDVELYRNEQLIGFVEVGDDGFYSFDNVDLFLATNNFKLIFYGPQGEVREETVSVPVNARNLSRGAGVYDVSVSLDQKNTYTNSSSTISDPDEGTVNVAALYEYPVLPGTTISAGIRSSEEDERRNTVVNIGGSTTIAETLLNGNVGVDDEGDTAAELTMRRDFGLHQLINTTDWQGGEYDTQNGNNTDGVGAFGNRVTMTGPVGLPIGLRPRYNMTVDYALDTDDNYALASSAGLSTTLFKSISFNEQLQHRTSNTDADDTLSSTTNIAGRIGRNRVRVGADYIIEPDSELNSVLATFRRYINKKLEAEAGITQRVEESITEYSASLDWQAGFIRISPSVRYNSEHDFFAGLNTRFGLLYSPSEKRINMYDRNITNNGIVSAFVYLDKNGDGEFNADDEPLEGVVVDAIQNGGREITDEHGIAMFTRMAPLKITDVQLDAESLQDPTWVTGFDGGIDCAARR